MRDVASSRQDLYLGFWSRVGHLRFRAVFIAVGHANTEYLDDDDGDDDDNDDVDSDGHDDEEETVIDMMRVSIRTVLKNTCCECFLIVYKSHYCFHANGQLAHLSDGHLAIMTDVTHFILEKIVGTVELRGFVGNKEICVERCKPKPSTVHPKRDCIPIFPSTSKLRAILTLRWNSTSWAVATWGYLGPFWLLVTPMYP